MQRYTVKIVPTFSALPFIIEADSEEAAKDKTIAMINKELGMYLQDTIYETFDTEIEDITVEPIEGEENVCCQAK